MDKVSMVADVVWVARGVPKHVPDKVVLDKEHLQELIESGEIESTDMSHEEDEETMDVDDAKGVRGSGPEGEGEEEGENVEKRYGLDEYDSDEEKQGKKEREGRQNKRKKKTKGSAMKGVAMYTSPLEDPYITQHVDSDAEEDKEDFELKPDDNLVVVAKIDREEFSLEVHVYNEANNDWYIHHDYALPAPPLVLTSIGYDPGADNHKGNLLAVGTMDSAITIWDLDIVNAVEPVVTLGEGAFTEKRKKKGKKEREGKSRKKRDGSAQCHTDAVLSVAWQPLMPHVVASGAADKSVILWDLDEAKAATVYGNFGAEVQSVAWHPMEASILLTGTMDGVVKVLDGREPTGAETKAEWKWTGTQVEKVHWNRFNPFNAFVALDNGNLIYIDSRKSGESLFEVKAHEGSITGISLSVHQKGLLTTVGEDETLSVWRVEAAKLERVHTETLNLGPLHAVSFCPDSPSVLVVGGEREDMTRVIELMKYEKVSTAFPQ